MMLGKTMLMVAVALFIAAPPPTFGLMQNMEEAIGLFNDGKYEEAAQLLRSLSESEPSNPQVHYYLGVALLEMGRLEEAESELSQASQKDLAPDLLKVGQARVALKKGEADRAIALLDEAQVAGPDNAEVYLYRGIAKASKQDFAAAVADLETAIKIDPARAQSHYYAGMVYGRLRRTDQMVNHYQMFLKLAPNSPEAPKIQSLLRSVR